MPLPQLYIQDVTLRDGIHAIRHQFTVEQVTVIARALDAAGVDAIEVTHGDGLAGSSFNYGFGRAQDVEWIQAAASVITKAKLTALLLPGIGTTHHLDRAIAAGIKSIRIATHCTEADVAREHIAHARNRGIDVAGLLMMAHLQPPAALAKQAKLMERYGAHCVYITDSAGALLPQEVAERVDAYRQVLDGKTEVGIHAHLGFTSRAKIVQMGLDEMIWGRLTDAMLIEDGGGINLSRFVHPRVEPEIAFLLKAPLSGRVDTLTAGTAIEAIAPALEIIDSRYHNFKFSLTDVIADNSSSSGFVVGPWFDPRSDFSNLGMVLEIDGVAVQVGSSAAILGHPLRSLVAASRLVDQRGERLNAGDIVLAGAATAAEAMPGKRSALLNVEKLGRIGFTIRS